MPGLQKIVYSLNGYSAFNRFSDSFGKLVNTMGGPYKTGHYRAKCTLYQTTNSAEREEAIKKLFSPSCKPKSINTLREYYLRCRPLDNNNYLPIENDPLGLEIYSPRTEKEILSLLKTLRIKFNLLFPKKELFGLIKILGNDKFSIDYLSAFTERDSVSEIVEEKGCISFHTHYEMNKSLPLQQKTKSPLIDRMSSAFKHVDEKVPSDADIFSMVIRKDKVHLLITPSSILRMSLRDEEYINLAGSIIRPMLIKAYTKTKDLSSATSICFFALMETLGEKHYDLSNYSQIANFLGIKIEQYSFTNSCWKEVCPALTFNKKEFSDKFRNAPTKLDELLAIN